MEEERVYIARIVTFRQYRIMKQERFASKFCALIRRGFAAILAVLQKITTKSGAKFPQSAAVLIVRCCRCTLIARFTSVMRPRHTALVSQLIKFNKATKLPVSAFDPAVRMALAPFSRRNRAVKEILLKGFASPSNFYYTRAWIQMQDFIADFNYCRETTVSPTRGTDRRPFQSRPKVPPDSRNFFPL